jgi:hypothetical protein
MTLSPQPPLPKGEGGTMTADEARAVLLRERQERLKAFNAEMVALTQKYGCRVVAVVTLPGGEQVSLASLLQALGIEGQPGLQIVEVSE